MAYKIYIDLICPDCKTPYAKKTTKCSNCGTSYELIEYKKILIPTFNHKEDPLIKPHKEFSDRMAGVLANGSYFELNPPKNAYLKSEQEFLSSSITKLKKENPLWNKLLDIGCGDGRYLKFATGLDFIVTGLDISSNMINSCIDICNDLGLQPGKFNPILADGTKLPLPNNTYHIILGMFGWPSFSSDYKKAIDEMFRVTRRGGHVYITTYNRDALANQITTLYPELDPKHNTVYPNDEWIITSLDKNGDPVKQTLFCHSFEPEEICTMFEESGFKIVNKDSILKLSTIFSDDTFKKVDPNFWLNLEDVANLEKGLTFSGSYIYLEACKP